MTTSNDLRTQLAADDGSLPERWNPDDEPGTMLIGTLLRFETIVTDYGEAKIAVIADDEDGTEWGVALFRSVLKNQFERMNPQPGDTVGLKYLGLTPPRSKGGNEYHNYKLRVIRGTNPPPSDVVSMDRGAPSTAPGNGTDDLPF